MATLPPPEFVKIDPAAIEADLIARYEAKSGKTLYPAQIERLFIDQIAYAKTLALSAIQNAGEKLLVRFSGGPILDYLGDLVSTPRLQAQPARCTQLFRLPAVATALVTIKAGTRITTADGRLAYYSEVAITIAAGAQEASATVICETPGEVGNGWALGQLSVLVSPPVDGMTTRNVTVPTGGSEQEQDEPYIERIILAPESFSTAGTEGGYIYHARAAHQDIIDVAVRGGTEDAEVPDGEVWVYPLTRSGLPSAELLALVQASISPGKKRPLTDKVLTKPPVEVPFTIEGSLALYEGADETLTLVAAQAAAERFAANLRAGLGRDIVPEQLIAALQVSGVYRVQLSAPAYRVVASHEWANCTAINLAVAGVAYG